MMIAFADDTAETLRRNGAFARQYLTSLQYLFEVPLPGTPLTETYEAADRIMWRDMSDLSYFDGMHVAIRPRGVSAREMQAIVAREYQRFYSRYRLAIAFVDGLFRRHRRLSAAQHSYCSQFSGLRRLKPWLWFHLEYKFAPWAFLRTGRRRVRDILNDADYQTYLGRLEM